MRKKLIFSLSSVFVLWMFIFGGISSAGEVKIWPKWESIPEESIEVSGESKRVNLISPYTEMRADQLEDIGHSRAISPTFHDYPKGVAIRCGVYIIEIFVTSPEVRKKELSLENKERLSQFLDQKCTYCAFDQAAEKH